MKHFVKFFVVTLFFLSSTYAVAEQNIAFIDMKYILNNSNAGKGAQTFLKKMFKDNEKNLNAKQEKLKKEEKDLLSKKGVLSKEDYNKETNILREKVAAYQAERRGAIDKIAKKRAAARQKLLDKLDPILKNYMTENKVSIILDKKDVVLGADVLDITKKITEKLNKELPTLNLN